jgi:NADH dehydrogenase
VNLVGIIREHRSRGITFERLHVQATANLLAVARKAGVKRYVQMSALGTRPEARSAYHRTKWQAEVAVRDSGIDWTIFRPSIIFGAGDDFISVLAGLVRRLPVVPVLGDGQYRLQPIPAEQVAEGFAQALHLKAAIGRTYEVGGPEAFRFVEILDQIGAAVGRTKVRKIHVPVGAVKLATRALSWLPAYPLTMDQIAMLEEESVTDPSAFFADLGITPEPFARGLARMLRGA